VVQTRACATLIKPAGAKIVKVPKGVSRWRSSGVWRQPCYASRAGVRFASRARVSALSALRSSRRNGGARVV